MSAWKPGDVAVNVEHGYRGIYVSGCRNSNHAGGVVPHWHNDSGAWDPSDDIRRPLVVIDPESNDVERLQDLFWQNQHHGGLAMQAALREFANPKPPKPDEPQGLGAVVRERHPEDGLDWVRVPLASNDARWFCGDTGEWREWSQIDAVLVLSEGVTP